jgi:hypothetical protein
MSLGAQNKKTGPDAVGTTKNMSMRGKHEKGIGRPSVLPKTSPEAQNIKTGPDALNTAENEYGRAKQENGT